MNYFLKTAIRFNLFLLEQFRFDFSQVRFLLQLNVLLACLHFKTYSTHYYSLYQRLFLQLIQLSNLLVTQLAELSFLFWFENVKWPTCNTMRGSQVIFMHSIQRIVAFEAVDYFRQQKIVELPYMLVKPIIQRRVFDHLETWLVYVGLIRQNVVAVPDFITTGDTIFVDSWETSTCYHTLQEVILYWSQFAKKQSGVQVKHLSFPLNTSQLIILNIIHPNKLDLYYQIRTTQQQYKQQSISNDDFTMIVNGVINDKSQMFNKLRKSGLPIILSTTMHRKKIEQIKTYSKIIKYRKNNGQIEEVSFNQTPNQPENNIEEEYEHQIPKEQDFQDVIQDQFEEEQGWISDSGEEEEINQSGTMMSEPKNNQMKEEDQKAKVFLGNNKNLAKGEVLQFDNKAYDMLHRLNVEWPSMSIDFVAKNSPFDTPLSSFLQMNQYPYQVFTVQGSCNNSNKNSIYFTKWSKLHQTKYDDDPQGNDDDQDPQIVVQQVETTFDVNRIRTLNNSPIVAFWNDDRHRGEVRIVDLSSNLQKLNNNVSSKRREKAKEIVIPFDVSGYGLAWNPHKVGQLVVGDNNGRVTVLANNANYTQWSKTATYAYHKGSVQDIVFSPQQSFVFASCSSDGTLQVVDMRANSYNKAQLKIKAHKKDVNVCDWNKMAAHLIVTGSDDCTVKVWDLRMASEGAEEQVLSFSWHTEPITSIKFQPNEQSVIAVASEDNRLSIWDMSVENEQVDPEVPNQLLFLHQGQQQIKQICYHPVYFQMIISTSLDAINIFKPALEMPEMGQDEKADQQDLKRPPVLQQELDKYIERMNIQ